jgi:hypothetical protein
VPVHTPRLVQSHSQEVSGGVCSGSVRGLQKVAHQLGRPQRPAPATRRKCCQQTGYRQPQRPGDVAYAADAAAGPGSWESASRWVREPLDPLRLKTHRLAPPPVPRSAASPMPMPCFFPAQGSPHPEFLFFKQVYWGDWASSVESPLLIYAPVFQNKIRFCLNEA